jgi:3-hydroxyisobutyrate dehydrogenase-like beta-hydroxyacid dehydrogenase
VAETATRIGFIGLGLMGRGMARNLVRKDFALTVMAHRHRAAVDSLVDLGASEAASVPELVDASDVVILCVTGTPEVESIFYDGGLLAAARGGLIVIDCTTAEPASTERLAAALAERGAIMVDAPLARTPRDAEEGRLNVMVGADEATFAKVLPILRAFGENVVHCGPPGHGHKIKLIYNFMSQGIAAMIAEALTACAATGVDLEKYAELVSAGGANSGIFQLIVPRALDGDLTGLQFSIGNARKDLRYYTHLTESAGVPSLMGEAAHQCFILASALGFDDKLVPALIEAQEKLTGIRITRQA